MANLLFCDLCGELISDSKNTNYYILDVNFCGDYHYSNDERISPKFDGVFHLHKRCGDKFLSTLKHDSQ